MRARKLQGEVSDLQPKVKKVKTSILGTQAENIFSKFNAVIKNYFYVLN